MTKSSSTKGAQRFYFKMFSSYEAIFHSENIKLPKNDINKTMSWLKNLENKEKSYFPLTDMTRSILAIGLMASGIIRKTRIH